MRVTKPARLNVRLSPATVAQLDELATVFGNRTAAITIAVDRMYNQERSIMSDVCPSSPNTTEEGDCERQHHTD